jgi:hypothetical protein
MIFNRARLQKKLEPAERLIVAADKLARKQGLPELKFNVVEVAEYLRQRGKGAYRNPQGFVDTLVTKQADRLHIKAVRLPSICGEKQFTN